MEGDYDMISDESLKSNRDRFLELENEFIMKDNDMEWISIKDRLPDSSGRYLVIRSSFVDIEVFFLKGSNSYWYNYLGITHWMTLPKPPKP